jgi:hypothetical protein
VDLSRIFKKAHESLATRIARKRVRAIDTKLETYSQEQSKLDEAIKAAQDLLGTVQPGSGGQG